MSLAYLVSAHCGGYYISSDDLDDIEHICETCGDCDRIVAEFDDEDAIGAANEILDYFAGDIVPDEFGLLTLCCSVDDVRSDIDETFSYDGLERIANELGLDSDDPINAAILSSDSRKHYTDRFNAMLDRCGVLHDGKSGDTAKQESVVMEIARMLDYRADALENLRAIACFNLNSKQRRSINRHKNLTSDDIDEIDCSYAGSHMHDGIVAAVRHNLQTND